MSTLAGLPIGQGAARTPWRPLTEAEQPELEEDGQAPVALSPVPAVEAPLVELVVWDAHRLRQPLKLVGKTVNWQVQRRSGIETEAGLMTEENLADIGEPLAEVFNRYEPTRALAARSAELSLALAVWDYAHETAHKAARDKLQLEAELRARTPQPAEEAMSHLIFNDEGGAET